MEHSLSLVVFTLDGQHFALELASVYRVIHAVEITPLPHAPAVILGIINVQGQLFPVVNLRHRFNLPQREVNPADQFILVELNGTATAASASNGSKAVRQLALVVDAVVGIQEANPESIVAGDEIVPDLAYVQGIAKVGDNLILIHDLERCLSLDEERALQDALAQMDE